MIYLKYFESDESGSEDMLYREIEDPYEWAMWAKDNSEKYTSFPSAEYWIDLLNIQPKTTAGTYTFGEEKRSINVDVEKKKKRINIEISEMEDEWYYVSIETIEDNTQSEKWYKCDQRDGLMQLLKDKKIIKYETIEDKTD